MTSVISNYKMISCLGKGHSGSVWEVYKKNNIYNQNIAVKLCKINHHYQRQAAMNEIDVLKIISEPSHNNVIKYYNSEIENRHAISTIFIEMEHINGTTLEEYGQKHRKASDFYKKMIQIINKLAKGIQYIHSKSIIHNDIKPANIMLDKDLNPKLIDFGLAKIGRFYTINKYDKKIFCCKNAVGSPGYSSPRLYLKSIGSFPSDVWSLGATFYDVVTGLLPFRLFNKSDYSMTNIDIKNVLLNDHPITLNSKNNVLNVIVNRSLIKIIKSRITIDGILVITNKNK